MRPPDDNCADMSTLFEVGGDDTEGLAAPGTAAMTAFLTDFKNLSAGPAPEPSPELAALLAGASPLSTRPRARRPGRAVLTSAAAAALVMLTGVAAAHHDLPAPAQQLVSTVVDKITPFHIDEKPSAPIIPATPTVTPTPDDRTSSAPAQNETGDDDRSATAHPASGAASPGEQDGSAASSGDSNEESQTDPGHDSSGAHQGTYDGQRGTGTHPSPQTGGTPAPNSND